MTMIANTESHLLNTLPSVLHRFLVSFRKNTDIVPWLEQDAGKTALDVMIRELTRQFVESTRERVVDENTIMVNLDAPPVWPYEYPEDRGVDIHQGGGWKQIQKRGEGLYVDDNRVIPYQHSAGRILAGYRLENGLMEIRPLNANIFDALYKRHQHLIPGEWKDAARPIYFTGTVFHAHGESVIVGLHWETMQKPAKWGTINSRILGEFEREAFLKNCS